jgi:hypothetical protein
LTNIAPNDIHMCYTHIPTKERIMSYHVFETIQVLLEISLIEIELVLITR